MVTKKIRFLFSVYILVAFHHASIDQLDASPEIEEKPHGMISGVVLDRETRFPLAHASISLVNDSHQAISDERGLFLLSPLPVGSYVLVTTRDGFNAVTRTDIVVRSGRETRVTIEMSIAIIATEEITVTSGYYKTGVDQADSSVSFSQEEIRRAPGSAGDVSRIISVLPSVAHVNDQLNSLAIRGGSPYENAFYVDGMAIPNINHYPIQGSTGGPIGLINVDFIADVNFSAGGFPAQYGDRLSSVMSIALRDGNRETFEMRAEFMMAGMAVSGEGPLPGRSGSWIFSARRSYLDLLVDAIGMGVAPRYSDYQARLAVDLTERQSLVILGVLGLDNYSIDQNTAFDQSNNYYGDSDTVIGFGGVNWRAIWSEKFFSQLSLSYAGTTYDEEFNETDSNRFIYKNRSIEDAIQLRNENVFRLSKTVSSRFGLEARSFTDTFDNFTASYVDPFGNQIDDTVVDMSIESWKGGAYMSLSWSLSPRLETIIGGRFDYFSYNENKHISPRFAISMKIANPTDIYFSTGIYYQNIPTVILAQKEEFKGLDDPRAIHYILGMNHLVTPETRMTVEVYAKEYDRFPMSPDLPLVFPTDELLNVESLVSNGKARSRGIEIIFQKKLVQDFYGLLSAAWFRSEYRNLEGKWQSRIYDNRAIASLEGGYKPNERWEFSLRWVYAGGRPFSPLDEEASCLYDEMIYDQSRYLEERLPAYHSLNLRTDRHYNFRNSNLTVFIDIWNAYDRKNLAYYYWNKIDKRQERADQWRILPIGGFAWEF